MTKAQAKAQEIEDAKDKLRAILPKGSTVYTILRHVSASGMSRRISVITIDKDGMPRSVDYYAATALDWKHAIDDDGVTVGGTGMDMGFHLVHTLAHALYGDGYALKHDWL